MMQGIHEFIVQIENPWIDKVGSIYVDPELDRTKFSNRTGIVVSTPLAHDSIIEKGDEVMVVQTVIMPHITQFGRSDSLFMVNKDKGHYRVEDSLIIMYKKPGGNWQCNGENVMIEPTVKKNEEKVGSLVAVRLQKEFQQYAKIAYINNTLLNEGLIVGDKVMIDLRFDHEFEVDGKILWRMNTRHILAKVVA